MQLAAHLKQHCLILELPELRLLLVFACLARKPLLVAVVLPDVCVVLVPLLNRHTLVQVAHGLLQTKSGSALCIDGRNDIGQLLPHLCVSFACLQQHVGSLHPAPRPIHVIGHCLMSSAVQASGSSNYPLTCGCAAISAARNSTAAWELELWSR